MESISSVVKIDMRSEQVFVIKTKHLSPAGMMITRKAKDI